MSDPALLADALRISDPDRYLSTLYAPESKRASLVALYSFNAEIASIRDRIRDALPGEVRLQWWRDVLEANSLDAAGGHPLALALISVIQEHQLPVQAFHAMLSAREFDLYDDPMPSRGDLEGYLGETASALIQLAALVLDRDAARAVAEAAGHAGCAQGIAGLLRLLPLHRARGQCYVPAEMLAAAGVTREDLLSGDGGAVRAVAAMTALAREHQSAFAALKPVSASVRTAFLPTSLTGLYLSALERAETGALSSPPPVSALRRHWRLMRAAAGHAPLV